MFDTAITITKIEMHLGTKTCHHWIFFVLGIITAMAHKIRDTDVNGCSAYCCQEPVLRNPNFQFNRPATPKDSTMVNAMP